MFKRDKDGDNLDILARRSTDKFGEIDSKISQDVFISGEIKGKNNIKLQGKFEGNANITGLFLVGSTGFFKGDLTADSVVIDGEFEGNVKLAKKLELRNSARFTGNINSQVVAIAEGSFFEGEIKMGSDSGNRQFAFEEKRKIRTGSDAD
jgi:cytoskeletal protein CcmA (bactofilin family)